LLRNGDSFYEGRKMSFKVTFAVKCKTYLEAATLEEFLKKEGLEYQERINDGSAVHMQDQQPKKKPMIRRPRMTPEGWSQIRNYIKMHPNWSAGQIHRHYKEAGELSWGVNTIQRVMDGHYDEKYLGSHRVKKVVALK
jgi:hypothetical protein